MEIDHVENISELNPDEWNRLAGGSPFLCHQFLSALENNRCVGPDFGWYPRHLVAHDEQGKLAGAIPLYLKTNSYGELVFDWSWAEAYQRHGLAYYPKLVAAIPYTPATGPRILVGPQRQTRPAKKLIDAAIEFNGKIGSSSQHWLFPDSHDKQTLGACGMLERIDVQFHWNNQAYRNFDDFLSRLVSKRRKEIRRERRLVASSGIRFEQMLGSEAEEHHWNTIHELYRHTFDDKWGVATLNLGFFREIGQTMGDRILLIFAIRENRIIAGALYFFDAHSLYGRHWGTFEHHPGLHFETCYYQGIEFCIERGLRRFEPGAQGEYKIARGFLPSFTSSMHWIEDPSFKDAISQHLQQERLEIGRYKRQLETHSPFRENQDHPAANPHFSPDGRTLT